jgi:hypothetical protein
MPQHFENFAQYLNMNVLLLYNATQTYTNTVFEHVSAFARFSKFRYFFQHHDAYSSFNTDLAKFDAILIHYSIRLPFDQISEYAAQRLAQYTGPKILFIQDEYDYTHRAWHWIKSLKINLVFTVVPEENIPRVYPPEEFPGVVFVSNLTGYFPEQVESFDISQKTSKRELVVGYRGRPLHLRYGSLGQEKVNLGRMVKQYCEAKSIPHDIGWTEKDRIYGPRWYEFMGSCRAMLGSESGSNVFDWEGGLAERIEEYRQNHLEATDDDVYKAIIEPCEVRGLMNQISPRIFEAIALRTALVLFEGGYSGIVSPYVHYIPLKKDGSNLDEVFALLKDGDYVDQMTERAYKDIFACGKYSYQSFVSKVEDRIIQISMTFDTGILPSSRVISLPIKDELPTPLTTSPIRAQPDRTLFEKFAYWVWKFLPGRAREALKPNLKKLFKRK